MIQDAKDIKIGETQVIEVYLGRELVWKLGGVDRECSGVIYTSSSLDRAYGDGRRAFDMIEKVVLKDKGQGKFDIDIYTKPYVQNPYTVIYIEAIKPVFGGIEAVSYKRQKLTNAKFSFKDVGFTSYGDTKELKNVLYTSFYITDAITDRSRAGYRERTSSDDSFKILAIGDKK